MLKDHKLVIPKGLREARMPSYPRIEEQFLDPGMAVMFFGFLSGSTEEPV